MGHSQFYLARGLRICAPLGDPRALEESESGMEEFIGKDDAFVEDWLVRQGLCFLNFRHFFITCKHINKSNNFNYILFITYRELRYYRRSVSFSGKESGINYQCEY